MAKARLMNRPEDYERIGIRKDQIEIWEDGRRDDYRKGMVEWWYFDAILDDGTKIAACYSTKIQPFMFMKGLHPCLTFHITTPEGKQLSRKLTRFKKDEVSVEDGKCSVYFGDNFFVGDMKDYHIRAVPTKGLGFDVRLHSIASPWRGETGYIGFEDGDRHERYFTWLCTVPAGSVEGTVTIDGVERQVKGFGYHDHQWGNIVQYEFLNNWLWSRQNTDNYSLLIFDFIMNENYEFERIPLCFLQDRKGNVLFESTDNVKCEVLEEYRQEASKTSFPKKIRYTFEADGKKLVYTLKVREELDGRYIYKEMPAIMRPMFKGTKPKYGRYLAEGEFTLYDGDQIISESGDLIYEFAYVGENYKEHMSKDKEAIL